MKRLNLYIISASFIALGLSSCTSGFDDYNKDPNRGEVGTATPSQMLWDVVYEGTSSLKYRSFRHNNELMQYTVETNTLNQIHRFLMTSNEFQGTWNAFGRWANSAIHMYKLGEQQKDPNAMAVALTMKVFYLSNMTDVYGDIPLKEAFRGDEGIMQPKFDDQKSVYDSLLMDLEKANTLYSTTSTIVPKTDILFKGDMVKWRKFNNSLYLRLLMRVSNRKEMHSAERIAYVFNNPIEYPVISSNAENAVINYTGERPNINDFGDNADDARKMGEKFINMMVESSDPRISTLCNRVGTGNQNTGGYFGLTSGAMPSVIADQNSSMYGVSAINTKTFRQYTSPYMLLPYAEVLFVKAEAIQRGMLPGNAGIAYNEAITASMRQWVPDISESAIETFCQNGAVAYDETTEIILNQKYVALFGVGYEAWHEYRRTGYPLLTMGDGVRNDGVHPTRFPYPETLKSSNKNYPAQAAKMGGDNMKSAVWWSRKALKKDNPSEDESLGYIGHQWDANVKW